MSTLFITATGTEIGKTFVTRALISRLRAQGRPVRALKPIASGFDAASAATSDSALLLQAQGLPLDSEALDAISPWRFSAPLSPDMAAAKEGRAIDFESLLRFCRGDPTSTDPTLIEGIGGVMVPLDGRHTVLDWIQALECPVLLVAGSYLGTLSHTLTAVGVLHESGCSIAGIVINESPHQPVPPEETADSLRRFVAQVPIGVLRRGNACDAETGEKLLSLVEGYL